MWFYHSKANNYVYKRTQIDIPVINKKSFINNFWDAVTDRTRFIFVSQITSGTGMILPVKELITEAGGIQYSIDKMEEYSDLALKAISHYPNSPIKVSLINLVSYNGSRIK